MAGKIKDRINQAVVYFRATEAVSKPIAFLMLFFGLSLVASMAIGVFALGQWGYRQVIHVDKPAVVSVPETNKPASDSPSSSVTVTQPTQNGSSTNQASTQQQVAATSSLPNTGTSLLNYAFVVLFGVTLHQILMRKKLARD